jgi:DNA (cytosine-5)-methyltransferase 1
MNELALFAGAGGGILGGHLLGWRTICAVEWEPYPASVLISRQNDGILPPFPIWDDVQTFDGKPWRGRVDVISGGFPCQDISIAGKGKGIEGERSKMWGEMARIIYEVKPRFVFVENSPELIRRGLGRVISDLSRMGYGVKWCCLGGNETNGICNGRRLWLVANEANSNGWNSPTIPSEIINKEEPFRRQFERASGSFISQEDYIRDRRGPNEVPDGMDRIKALGNAQVPAVAALAWETLNGRSEVE